MATKQKCDLHKCDECDGSGRVCGSCVSAAHFCECDEEDQDLSDCLICDGSGINCYVHKAGSPTKQGPCNGAVEVEDNGRN